MMKGSLPRFWFAAGLSAILAFSVAWVWHVGHRGLFLLDQSIVFDAAWRLSQGQVPYRDFYMPFGPVAFLLPALFFWALGPDFSGLVSAACVLSALGTALAVGVSLRLTRSRALALLGGALTAVWFQAPFGVPWMEQTAFLFDLLALAAVAECRASRRVQLGLAVAGGVASMLSILSKQNAGGLFVLVCLGCLALPGRGPWPVRARLLVGYALGGSLAALVFAAWLVTRSNVGTFWHYWVEVSAETGLRRIETWKLMGTVFFQTVVSSSAPLFGFATAVGVAAWGWMLRPDRAGPPRPELAQCAWLALALPQFHNAFQLTTNNDAANNNAFVGVCLVAALSLVPGARREVGGWPWRLGAFALLACVAYSFGDGLLTARDRNVQEFFGARFETRLAVPGLERVVWGEPTRITPSFCGNLGDTCKLSREVAQAERPRQLLQREDFERVARELRARNENVFVFPDATILYGLSGRLSPQPLLYFHPGQSFLLSDRGELDRVILQALQRNKVTLVVLERASFMGTHRDLATFPRLAAWIQAEFEPELELGNYRVLRRREPRDWNQSRNPAR